MLDISARMVTTRASGARSEHHRRTNWRSCAVMNPIDASLEHVEVFTTGAIGRPGQRTFFLQMSGEGSNYHVKCEKLQVAAISQYLMNVLQDLPPADERPIASSMALSSHGDPAFVLGRIALGYDAHNDRLILELAEMGDTDEEDEYEELGRIRLSITRGQAIAFCEHADAAVSAGRPPCHWCDGVVDPDGHVCPRMN